MGSVNPIVGSARTRAVEAPSKKNNKTRIGTSGETVDSRKVHWFTRLYSCIQHCIIHTCSTRTKSRCIDTQVRDTYVYFRFISRFIYAIYIYIYTYSSKMLFAKMQTLWNIYTVLKYLYRLNSILNETSKRNGTRVIRVILENFLDRLSERDEKNKRGWYTVACFSTYFRLSNFYARFNHGQQSSFKLIRVFLRLLCWIYNWYHVGFAW